MVSRKLALKRVKGPGIRHQACSVTVDGVALQPTFSICWPYKQFKCPRNSTIKAYLLKCFLLLKEAQKSFMRLCRPNFGLKNISLYLNKKE